MSLPPGMPNRRSFDGFWNEFFHLPTIVWAAIWAGIIEAVHHRRRIGSLLGILRPKEVTISEALEFTHHITILKKLDQLNVTYRVP